MYTVKHRMHRTSEGSRENPKRLDNGLKFIKNRTDVLDSYELIEDFPPASDEDLLRAHEKSYIDFMEGYCRNGGGFLGDSTYVHKGSCTAARYSAGGAITVCKEVLNNKKPGFALIRPPGHHALADNYGGYCLYNNAAIAAKWLQNKKQRKIMIIDWDGHAANGTMRIFYDDPTVLTISIHRDPHGFYPHDGYIHQIGKGAGRGYSVNVCLPPGSGDNEFRMACEQIVFPIAREFSPHFVIGCNGFDSHYSDNVVGLRLTSQSYYHIAKNLSEMFSGRFGVIMEGGYEKFNGKLLHALLSGLLRIRNPYEESLDISGSVIQQGGIRKETKENLSNIKEVLSDYHIGVVFEDAD